MSLLGIQITIENLVMFLKDPVFVVAIVVAWAICIWIFRHYKYKTDKMPFDAFQSFTNTQRETFKDFSNSQHNVLREIKDDLSKHHDYSSEKATKIETLISTLLQNKNDK